MLCIFHQNNVFKKTHRWKKVSRIFGTLNKNAKVTLWSSVCILPCRHLSELTSSTSLRKLLALCHDYSSKKAYLFWVFVNFGMNFQGQYFRLSSVYNPGDHCPPPPLPQLPWAFFLCQSHPFPSSEPPSDCSFPSACSHLFYCVVIFKMWSNIHSVGWVISPLHKSCTETL